MSLYTDPIDTHGHTVADVIARYPADVALGDGVALANPSAAADDIIDTSAAHGFAAGTPVVFSAKTGGTGVTVGQVYYVIAANLGAQTFQFSATPGGAAVNFTTDITAGTVHPLQPAASQGDLVPASGDVMLAQTAAEVNAQLG